MSKLIVLHLIIVICLSSCNSDINYQKEGHWISSDPLSHQIVFSQDTLYLYNDLYSLDRYTYQIVSSNQRIILHNEVVDTSILFAQTDSSFIFDDLIFVPHPFLETVDFQRIPKAYDLIDLEFDTMEYAIGICSAPIHITKENSSLNLHCNNKTISIQEVSCALESHHCANKEYDPLKIFIGQGVTNDELHEVLYSLSGFGVFKVDLITKKYSNNQYSGLRYRIPLLLETADSIRSKIRPTPPPFPRFNTKRELVSSGIKEITICSIRDTSILTKEILEQDEHIITMNTTLGIEEHLELYNWLVMNGMLHWKKNYFDRKPIDENCN